MAVRGDVGSIIASMSAAPELLGLVVGGAEWRGAYEDFCRCSTPAVARSMRDGEASSASSSSPPPPPPLARRVFGGMARREALAAELARWPPSGCRPSEFAHWVISARRMRSPCPPPSSRTERLPLGLLVAETRHSLSQRSRLENQQRWLAASRCSPGRSGHGLPYTSHRVFSSCLGPRAGNLLP